MGARGPVNLHIVRGDGKKDSAVARLAPKSPAKPVGLPPEVDELWDELVPVLSDAGLLSEADGLTLEMALRHFVVARAASDVLIESGVVVEDKRHGSQEAKSPRAQVFKDNSAAFLEFAKQLGLSFVARARVTMKEPDNGESNPFAASR